MMNVVKLLPRQFLPGGFLSAYSSKPQMDDVVEDLAQLTSKEFVKRMDQLETYNRYWPYEMEGQKALASLAHSLYKGKRYSDVQTLTHKLKAINFEVFGGLATTLLYSTLADKRWDEAQQQFHEMQSKGQVRHSRIHRHLITTLLQNKQLSLACKYIAEFVELEKHAVQLKKPDIALVECLLDSVELNEHDSHSIILLALQYLDSKRTLLEPSIVNRLVNFTQAHTEWTVIRSSYKEGQCSNCEADLHSEDFSGLCSEMLLNIREESDAEFDVIIDGANVLFHGHNKYQHAENAHKSLQFLIENVLSVTKDQSVAIVLPKHFGSHGKQAEVLASLREIENSRFVIIVSKNDDDDLCVLRMAAQSELAHRLLGVVSNDCYSNHVNVAKKCEDKWNRFIKKRVKTFDVNYHVDFCPTLSSVQLDKNNFHLYDQKQVWCGKCI